VTITVLNFDTFPLCAVDGNKQSIHKDLVILGLLHKNRVKNARCQDGDSRSSGSVFVYVGTITVRIKQLIERTVFRGACCE